MRGFLAARPAFLAGSVVPVAVAGAYVHWMTGAVDVRLWVVIAVAMVLLHLAGDLFYEYFDSMSGAEDLGVCYVSAFSGSGRAIQRGLVPAHEVLFTALVCLALAAAIGFYLAASAGFVVILLGVFGALTLFFYSAPPVRLVHHGAGEIVAGFDFGILPMLGTQYVLSHQFTWQMLILSLPVTFLIIAMSLVNRFPECDADALVGKRHLVVVLGRSSAAVVTLVLYVLALAVTAGEVAMLLLPTAVLFALAAAVPAGQVVQALVAEPEEPAAWRRASPAGVLAHLLYGVAMTLALLLVTPVAGR
jgi:1,4-dihydroxy-2-naphthoate octaprenyltransferase